MMKLENLITENADGILLSSYEIPEGEDRNAFSYASMKNVDYSKLKNLKSSHRHYTGKRMESGKEAVQAISHRS